MADEKLVFDVLAKASGAGDVQKLGGALDDVGKSVDDLGKSVDELGKKDTSTLFAGLADGADDAGEKLKTTLGSDFDEAFAHFEKSAEQSAKAVANDFGSGFDDVFAHFTSNSDQAAQKSRASFTTSFQSLFSKLKMDATEAGQSAGQFLSKGLSGALEDVGPLGPTLIGVVAAAAPFAGAVLAGGLIAGISSAGLAGGVILALQDPAIKSAAADLGKNIMDDLKVDSVPFKQPVLDAISVLDQAWTRSNANIQTLFSNTAPLLVPLTESVGSAINSITAGIANLSSAAAPVMGALGEGVKMVGDAIGQGFSSLSDDGAAAATALTGAFAIISTAIKATFAAVDGLTTAFGWLAEHGVLGPGVSASYANWKSTLDNVKSSMDGLGNATTTTTNAMQQQADELKAQTDPIFALANAQSQAAQKQTALSAAVRKYGADSQQAKQASLDFAAASVDLRTKTEAAASTFNGQMPAGLLATLKAAGATKSEIDLVSKAFENVEAKGTSAAKTYKATFITVFEQIGKPSSVPLTANTYKGLRWGGVVHAEQGYIAKGGSNLIHWAEEGTGDELFMPRRGNEARNRQLAQVAASWTGGQISWPDSRTSGAGSPVRSQGSSGGAPMTGVHAERIIAELRAIRQSGGGDVYLDSRLVGAVQGRSAWIRARTR